MEERELGSSGVTVSPVGLDARFIGTEAWDHQSDEDIVELLKFAFRRGMTYVDTGAVYGDGRSEELLGRALAEVGGDPTIGTRIGYADTSTGDPKRDFTPGALRTAVERSRDRLGTDSIDVVFLHDATVDEVGEAVVETLVELRDDELVRALGWELGPGIGWLAEGERAIEHEFDAIGTVFNLLEQGAGRHFVERIRAEDADTTLVARAPHASDLLNEKVDRGTDLDAVTETTGRPQEWFETGWQKLDRLRFLERDDRRTMGEAAVQYLLAYDEVATVTPTVRTGWDIKEYTSAPETPPLTDVELSKAERLYDTGFGVEADDGMGPAAYGSSVGGDDVEAAGLLDVQD